MDHRPIFGLHSDPRWSARVDPPGHLKTRLISGNYLVFMPPIQVRTKFCTLQMCRNVAPQQTKEQQDADHFPAASSRWPFHHGLGWWKCHRVLLVSHLNQIKNFDILKICCWLKFFFELLISSLISKKILFVTDNYYSDRRNYKLQSSPTYCSPHDEFSFQIFRYFNTYQLFSAPIVPHIT